MHRIIVLLFALIAAASISSVTAGDATLAVSVSAPVDGGKEGDACVIHAPRTLSQHPIRWFDGTEVTTLVRQIVVENERHDIIAVAPLDDGTVMGEDTICAVRLEIPLAEATFYSVRLDGEHITTIPAREATADRQLVVALDG
mgnify:CR=1 FL=1